MVRSWRSADGKEPRIIGFNASLELGSMRQRSIRCKLWPRSRPSTWCTPSRRESCCSGRRTSRVSIMAGLWAAPRRPMRATLRLRRRQPAWRRAPRRQRFAATPPLRAVDDGCARRPAGVVDGRPALRGVSGRRACHRRRSGPRWPASSFEPPWPAVFSDGGSNAGVGSDGVDDFCRLSSDM